MYYEDPIPGTQNWAFRVYRYAPDFPGFDGKDLTPGDPIELYTTSIEEIKLDLIPKHFELFQNYPNPFNPSTLIKYSVPENGFVKLSVYNLVGEEVKLLISGQVDAGFYEIEFDATSLPSGIYFYKLQAGNYVETKKMVLLR